MDEKYIKRFVDTISKVRGVARESLSGYEQMMQGSLKGKGPEAIAAVDHRLNQPQGSGQPERRRQRVASPPDSAGEY